ncbi:chemotaxis protein CheW, partial [Escherichia coli]|nr:chemotaxis protein CheW [Escherichia coli]
SSIEMNPMICASGSFQFRGGWHQQ